MSSPLKAALFYAVLVLAGCSADDVTTVMELDNCRQILLYDGVEFDIARGEQAVAYLSSREAVTTDQVELTDGFKLRPANQHVKVRLTCPNIEQVSLFGSSAGILREGLSPQRLSAYAQSQIVVERLDAGFLDLRVAGQGQMVVTALDADELSLMASGNARMVVTGSASTARMDLAGQAEVDANDLQVQTLKVLARGQAKLAAWATAHLDRDIDTEVAFSLRGTPVITEPPVAARLPVE